MKKISYSILASDKDVQTRLQERIANFDSFELSMVFSTHTELIEVLTQACPHILFIDADAKEYDILDILKIIPKPAFIIALTNNKLRIPELLDNGITDFLTPKIELITFCKKISKILNIINTISSKDKAVNLHETAATYNSGKTKRSSCKEYMFIKHQKVQYKLIFDEIAFIQNTGNCLRIETSRGKVLYHNTTMKKFLALLPDDIFYRINKSTIINYNKVEKIEQNKIYIKKQGFIVSRIFAPKLKDMHKKSLIAPISYA